MPKYDDDNKKSLIDGYQITMLRSFLESKNKAQIINVGGIYYLVSKYWPDKLADQYRKELPSDIEVDVSDQDLITQNAPLRYFSSGEYNWEGISKTIDKMDDVLSDLRKNR